MMINKPVQEMTWQEMAEWAHGVIMFIRIGGNPSDRIVEDWVSAYETKSDLQKA